MKKAKLSVKNISRINDKTILQVDSISDGVVKLYGVYNLSNKFNIRINNFYPESNEIFSHPVSNLNLEIQLIENYKKIEMNDILEPLD
jgi:hypothetical protein